MIEVVITRTRQRKIELAPEGDDLVAEDRRRAGQRHRADDGADDGAGEPDGERLPGAVGETVAAHDQRLAAAPRKEVEDDQ